MNIQLETANMLLAQFALIVYGNAHGSEGVVMQHALSHDGQALRLAEGTPVTSDLIKKLQEMNQSRSLTFIPPGVIAQGVGCLAWVQEAELRPLLSKGALDPAVAVLDATPLPQPRLLFVVKQRQLHVYALRGQERPGPNTTLYRAPYYNIFSSDTMCVGSVKLPGGVIEPNHIPAWTEAFFMSNFVKPADSNKRWAFPSTYRELWDAALAAGTFKDEWLVSCNKRLQDVLGGA